MVADCAAGVRDALDRAASEREQVLAKRRVVERFERHVREPAVQSARPPARTTRATACGATSVAAATRQDDAADESRWRVCELFAETIRPHNVSDTSESEPLAVMIREEFGPEVVTVLSPDVGSRFAPAARETVMSAVTERQRGFGGIYWTLNDGKRSLQATLVVLDEHEDWVARVDETSLSELGFDALRRRHETLAGHREVCDQLVHRRRRHLNRATHHAAAVEVDHRFLTTYFCEDRATDYPVLAAATRVDDGCADCRRAVRDHPVRRV